MLTMACVEVASQRANNLEPRLKRANNLGQTSFSGESVNLFANMEHQNS